ncbi:hypothetical protein F5B17DRAFT_434540 [Nemania serpens]|nr:hypothetical protein F5B17DRAFT_434540 [Nemania serpens]
MTFNANAQLLEIDIARTYLVCTLFAKGIGKMHGGTSAYMIWDEKWIYIATHFVRKDSFLWAGKDCTGGYIAKYPCGGASAPYSVGFYAGEGQSLSVTCT